MHARASAPDVGVLKCYSGSDLKNFKENKKTIFFSISFVGDMCAAGPIEHFQGL
jgi:hypothetical protein